MLNQTASFRVSAVIARLDRKGLDRKAAGHVQTFEQRQTAERAARKQLGIDLTALAAAIADELRAGWTLDVPREDADGDDHGHRTISHTDGRSFDIYTAIWNPDGKVSVSGNFDYGDSALGISFPYGKSQPKISVSMDRGAATIAKEITRRFLPDYDRLFAEISETVRVYTENRDRKTAIVGRLAAVAGANPNRIKPNGFAVYHGMELPNVEVTVYGTVSIKLDSLTEEMAAEILKLANVWISSAAKTDAVENA